MSVAYGYHKRNKDDLVNLINYMSHKFLNFKDHSFLGFIPTTIEFNFGIVINNVNYLACHIFYYDKLYADDPKETKELAIKNPWILMFLGNDNTSCMMRFINKQEAIDFFNNLSQFDKNLWDQCLFYNS